MNDNALHKLRRAIGAYNDGFLQLKKMNIHFQTEILKIPVHKAAFEKHLEEAKPLLEVVQEVKASIEDRYGFPDEDDFYDISGAKEYIQCISPPTVRDGYLFEAMRQYFLHTLKLSAGPKLFEEIDDRYFDFRLDHFFEDKTLIESMEVKHTRDWAMIGQALALKEIERITKKRGRRKKTSEEGATRQIDLKRAYFADGVLSALEDIYFDDGVEDFNLPTDMEVIEIYRAVLSESKSGLGFNIEELERHIRLENITDQAVCNSISRGREGYHYIDPQSQ